MGAAQGALRDRPLNKAAGVRTHQGRRTRFDQRYSVDHSKISDELGYQPQVPFDQGLADTITWYRENRDWWEPLKARSAIDR